MAVNKVEYGGETLIDLTDSTVDENTLLDGAVAYNAAGEKITGAVVVAPIDSALSGTSENPVQNKVVTAELNNKAKASELTLHTSDKSNPHSVTKSQVGLGNVPNVATNDQAPTYSDTTTFATLASGEKLSVAFAKIKLAITNLINHIANKSNPHGVTKSQIGLGNVENKTSATIRGELTKDNVTTALGYTPPTTNTTYSTATSTTAGVVKIGYTENGKNYPVELSDGKMFVNVPWTDNDTVYTHPSSGVTAGTYKSVTVNSAGHVTGGTNPTTLAGYGITDGATADHTHNYLPSNGGTLAGTLEFKKAENGYARILKNHSSTADYGLNLNDVDSDGDTAKLIVSAKNNSVSFQTTDGTTNALYGVHNKPTAEAIGALPLTGGTMTGTVVGLNANYTGHCLRNIDVRDSSGVTSQNTNLIRFDRK